jgi:hypothetical protein
MGAAGRERAAREGARLDGAAATVQRACRARAARRAARGEWVAGAASVADARRAAGAAAAAADDGSVSPSEDEEVGVPGLDEEEEEEEEAAEEGAGEEEQVEGGGDDGEQRHRERQREGRRAVTGAAPTLPPRLAFRSAHAKVLCARGDARRWGVAQALCWLKHVVGRAPGGKREGAATTTSTSSMAALYGAAFADAAVDGVVLLGCLCDDDLRQEPFCMGDAGHRRHIMGKVAELRESTRRAARAGRAARRGRAS